MGAISGLYAMYTLYGLVRDRMRDNRLAEELSRKGLDEEHIKAVQEAMLYWSSPRGKQEEVWKKNRPGFREQREKQMLDLVDAVLRNPDTRHAWFNNPKREAEIAKSLEDEETQFSERLNRLEAALRAQGEGEDTIGVYKAAVAFDRLSLSGRDQVWEMSPVPKTPEARAKFERDVQLLVTSMMILPVLRHAWLNDPEREAEFAKMLSAAADVD